MRRLVVKRTRRIKGADFREGRGRHRGPRGADVGTAHVGPGTAVHVDRDVTLNVTHRQGPWGMAPRGDAGIAVHVDRGVTLSVTDRVGPRGPVGKSSTWAHG